MAGERTGLLEPPPCLPALVMHAGEAASLRFLDFFTVDICNRNTRAAYGCVAAAFMAWCEQRGIRKLLMLFDWMVTGQVISSNPAHAVRGPRHPVTNGKTPVLLSEEASTLLASRGVSTVVRLRWRAKSSTRAWTYQAADEVCGQGICAVCGKPIRSLEDGVGWYVPFSVRYNGPAAWVPLHYGDARASARRSGGQSTYHRQPRSRSAARSVWRGEPHSRSPRTLRRHGRDRHVRPGDGRLT